MAIATKGISGPQAEQDLEAQAALLTATQVLLSRRWSHCMPLEPSPLAGQTGCAERVSAWRRGGAVRGDAAQGGLSAEQNRAARAARGGAARPPGTQHLSQSRLTQPCLFCIPPEEYRNEGGSARAVRQRGSPPTAGCDAAARRGAQVAALGQERNLLFERAQVG